MDEVQLEKLALSGAVFFLTVVVLLIIRGFAFGAFRRWAKKTETKLDDILVTSLSHPSFYVIIAVGLYVALGTSKLPPVYIDYGQQALYVVMVLAVTLALAGLVSRVVDYTVEKRGAQVPATGITRAIINGVILALGALIILNGLGISITPILTALGVGGLAVALALQDTLANLFAGLHIVVEKPLRVGDYIKLDSGQEGFVDDIGWRTTRIKKLGNNIVVVPNSVIAQSTITNYNMPDKWMSLLIPVGVGYDSDPENIEKVLMEVVGGAVGEVKGLRAEPAPFVRFIPGFGESSLDFTIICKVETFVDQYFVQHEIRKRIFKRFNEEGIEIPFPQRTVHLVKE